MAPFAGITWVDDATPLNADNMNRIERGISDIGDQPQRTARAIKEPVVALAQSNVSISVAPATIDGITLASGDRVLLAGQAASATNGLWQFNGPGSALSRTADASAASAFTRGMLVEVTQGFDYARSLMTYDAPSNPNLGSDNLYFRRAYRENERAGAVRRMIGQAQFLLTAGLAANTYIIDGGGTARVNGVTAAMTGGATLFPVVYDNLEIDGYDVFLYLRVALAVNGVSPGAGRTFRFFAAPITQIGGGNNQNLLRLSTSFQASDLVSGLTASGSVAEYGNGIGLPADGSQDGMWGIGVTIAGGSIASNCRLIGMAALEANYITRF